MTDTVTLLLSLFFLILGAARGFINSLLVPLSIIIATALSILYYQITKDIFFCLAIGLISPMLVHLLLRFLLNKFINATNREIRPGFLSRLGGSAVTFTWGWAFITLALIVLAVLPPWGKTLKAVHNDVVKSASYFFVNPLGKHLLPVPSSNQNPDANALAEDPRFMEVLQDPGIQKEIDAHELIRLMSNPKMIDLTRQILGDPSTMKKIIGMYSSQAEDDFSPSRPSSPLLITASYQIPCSITYSCKELISITDIVTLLLSFFFLILGSSRGFMRSLLVPFSIIAASIISILYYQITKEVMISLIIGLIGPFLLHLLLKFLLKTFAKATNREIRPNFLSRSGGAILTFAWGWIFIAFTLLLLAVLPPWGETLQAIHDDVVKSASYSLIEPLRECFGTAGPGQNTRTANAPSRQNPDANSLAEDPRFIKVLQDPDIQKEIDAHDIVKLMSNPKMMALTQEIMSDPATMKKVMALYSSQVPSQASKKQ